ncbi:MAG TPA: hypothetical protein VIT67_08980 [Povalibacter sp.]|jgi:hypothetical protein
MRQSIEIAVELTAQELLDQPDPTGFVEVHDICQVEEIKAASGPINVAATASDEAFEIELTAEEMDALLEGRWPE